MATYYTSFSCVLDLASAANVPQALALFTDRPADDDGMTFPDGFTAEADDSSETSVWIHDGGRGDVEQVIRFASLCAEIFGLKGRWGFEYSLGCSRPLLDAFGGGAHAVDFDAGTTHSWVSTSEWLATALAEGRSDA